MSTREIAELTGKEHFNVLIDTRKMLDELGYGGDLSFQGSYLSAQNKPLPLFNLPKRETLILVSGYSVALRAKIVDRWQELEAPAAGPALPNFADPAEAAMAWAQQYREKQALALQTQALALENQTAQGVNTLGSDRHG